MVRDALLQPSLTSGGHDCSNSDQKFLDADRERRAGGAIADPACLAAIEFTRRYVGFVSTERVRKPVINGREG